MTLLNPDTPRPDDVGWRTSSPLPVRRAKSIARLTAASVLVPLFAICIASRLWDAPRYALLSALVAALALSLHLVTGSPISLRIRAGRPTRRFPTALSILLAASTMVPVFLNYRKGYFVDPIPLALPSTLILTLCCLALAWSCLQLTLALRAWERHEDGFCVACDYDLRSHSALSPPSPVSPHAPLSLVSASSSPAAFTDTLPQCPECGYTLGRLDFHNWSIPHSRPQASGRRSGRSHRQAKAAKAQID